MDVVFPLLGWKWRNLAFYRIPKPPMLVQSFVEEVFVLLSCSAGDRTEDLVCARHTHPQPKRKFVKQDIEGHSEAVCVYTTSHS